MKYSKAWYNQHSVHDAFTVVFLRNTHILKKAIHVTMTLHTETSVLNVKYSANSHMELTFFSSRFTIYDRLSEAH